MVKAIEVLVHAGGPSNLKDDERYKAQAEAYLDYEGENVEIVTVPGEHVGGSSRPKDNPVPRPSIQSLDRREVECDGESGFPDGATKVVDPDNEVDLLDDTQLALTVLESQIVSSNARLKSSGQHHPGANSGKDRRLSAPQEEIPQPSIFPSGPVNLKRKAITDNSMHSARTESSSVQSQVGERTPSSYLKSPELDRSVKRIRKYAKRVQAEPENPPNLTIAPIQNNDPTVPGCVGNKVSSKTTDDGLAARMPVQQVSQPSVSNEITSELPTSYSLSNITTESSKDKSHSMQRSVSDPGPAVISISDDTPVSDRTHEEPGRHDNMKPCVPTKSAQTTRQTINIDGDVVVTSSRAKAAVQSTRIDSSKARNPPAALYATAPSPWLTELQTLPMYIQPPSPPTGLGRFSTHVTPSLRHLAESSPVATHYAPVQTSRELRPLERGYWTFDASRMALELQVKFWQYLQRLVGSGNVGWGVWCAREPDNMVNTDSQIVEPTGLGIVKVYCWGEVVKHVYLLLYVASQSKVRKLGLEWIDSNHKAVVHMREG